MKGEDDERRNIVCHVSLCTVCSCRVYMFKNRNKISIRVWNFWVQRGGEGLPILLSHVELQTLVLNEREVRWGGDFGCSHSNLISNSQWILISLLISCASNCYLATLFRLWSGCRAFILQGRLKDESLLSPRVIIGLFILFDKTHWKDRIIMIGLGCTGFWEFREPANMSLFTFSLRQTLQHTGIRETDMNRNRDQADGSHNTRPSVRLNCTSSLNDAFRVVCWMFPWNFVSKNMGNAFVINRRWCRFWCLITILFSWFVTTSVESSSTLVIEWIPKSCL